MGVPVLLTPAVELVSTRLFARLAAELTEVVATAAALGPAGRRGAAAALGAPVIVAARAAVPPGRTVVLLPPNGVGVATLEPVAPPPVAGSATGWTGVAKLADGIVARAAPVVDAVLFPPPGDVVLPGAGSGLVPVGVGSP